MNKEVNWGNTSLGIELGSTRIKASIIDSDFQVVAEGSSTWENKYQNGYWTYSFEEIESKLQEAYSALKKDVKDKYGVVLNKVGSIGISAMMHGYIVLDKNDKPLVPFRTWRNVSASKAAGLLSKKFAFNIPARWSIAHLYQAYLDDEEHIQNIAFLTTLAGYIHYKLCNKKVLGVGDASGVFPINPKTKQYDEDMKKTFNELMKEKGLSYQLDDILPEVLNAGEEAGRLNEEGARFLDVEGDLQEGILLCPPEGDAGTGMVCTNSILPLTGNISAGTSIFGMIVLKEKMHSYYPEVDVVTTPIGDEVAMIHCNNCTSEINAWVNMFKEYSKLIGVDIPLSEIYEKLFLDSLNGEDDCGGLLTYNYTSGENITGIANGRPLLVRSPEARFNLPNFIKAQIYSAFATLKYGVDNLCKKEDIKVDSFSAAGGIFKTQGVAEVYLASALDTPITLSKNANEGGSYGMAVLAMYAMENNCDLPEYLNKKVFKNAEIRTINPNKQLVEGFNAFEKRYIDGLTIEKEADKWSV